MRAESYLRKQHNRTGLEPEVHDLETTTLIMRPSRLHLLQVHFTYLICRLLVEEMTGEEPERDDVDLLCLVPIILPKCHDFQTYVGMDSYQSLSRKEETGPWEGMT